MNAEQLIRSSEIAQQGIIALRTAGDVRILARDIEGNVNPKSFSGEMRDTAMGLGLSFAARRHHVDMPKEFLHQLPGSEFPLTADYIHYWKYVALASWAEHSGADITVDSNWHGKRAAKLRARILPREKVFPEIVHALEIFHENVTGRVLL
ncbi:MAG: hypothetical protein WCL07_01250 [bacterium]